MCKSLNSSLTIVLPLPIIYTQTGLLVVWKVDQQGKIHPSPLHQHRLHSTISHCVMWVPSTQQGTSLKSKGSVLDAYSWQNRSAIMMAQNISDPIACFAITGEGIILRHRRVEKCSILHNNFQSQISRSSDRLHILGQECMHELLAISKLILELYKIFQGKVKACTF